MLKNLKHELIDQTINNYIASERDNLRLKCNDQKSPEYTVPGF